MIYNTLSLRKRLFFSDEALTVTLSDPEVATTMASYGFTPERLAEGRTLYEATFAAYNNKKDQYALQLEASDRMNTLLTAFRTQFRNDRQIVRSFLGKKRSVLEPFGLNEAMGATREVMVSQANQFYAAVKNSDAVMAGLMNRYGTTLEMIDVRLAELATLVEAISDHQVKRAAAQVATQRRQETMDQLDAWMIRFIRIAQTAFSDEVKQLEKLGLVVVLNPTRTKEGQNQASNQTGEDTQTGGDTPDGEGTPNEDDTPNGEGATGDDNPQAEA